MNSLDNREIITLFPTLMFKGKVSDANFISDLERKARTLKTLGKGHFEHKNFVSGDDLHKNEDFKPLVDLVMQESKTILDFHHVVRDSHYITNMWCNITNPNHRHPVHIHPNCFMSGIIYLTAPAKCGMTSFTDPRPGARVFEPNYNQMNASNCGLFRHEPEKGVMLFWPSWLPHGVDIGFNDTKEDRIVIAFNIMIKGEIKTPTASLVL
jgi:uncharacterized protein (TIGR02466 family)